MIELLLAFIAGLVGGLLSRYIPALPWRRKQTKAIEADVPDEHKYEVRFGQAVIFAGDDLHMAKVHRRENPGSVLIADGVNRG